MIAIILCSLSGSEEFRPVRDSNICGAVLYQLRYQASWELVMWVYNKPEENGCMRFNY